MTMYFGVVAGIFQDAGTLPTAAVLPGDHLKNGSPDSVRPEW
jgi:hypothetical protein